MKEKFSRKEFTGVICSSELDKAYCFENSELHKRMRWEAQDIGKNIVYINNKCLPSLIHNGIREKGGIKFNMDKILEYKIWTKEIR